MLLRGMYEISAEGKIWTGLFFEPFLDHFNGGGKNTISTQGGVGAVYQYCGRQSVITQGGVREGLLLRWEGWEGVVIVNITSRNYFNRFFD